MEDGEVKYLVSATKLSSHHERNTLTVSYQDLDTHNSDLANRVLENYFRSVTMVTDHDSELDIIQCIVK